MKKLWAAGLVANAPQTVLAPRILHTECPRKFLGRDELELLGLVERQDTEGEFADDLFGFDRPEDA